MAGKKPSAAACEAVTAAVDELRSGRVGQTFTADEVVQLSRAAKPDGKVSFSDLSKVMRDYEKNGYLRWHSRDEDGFWEVLK